MTGRVKFSAVVLAVAVVVAGSVAQGQDSRFILRVSASNADCVNVPVHTAIKLPAQLADVPTEEIAVVVKERSETGAEVPGQIVRCPAGKTRLWWIIPQAKANEPSTWVATLSRGGQTGRKGFSFSEKPGDYLDLLFDGRKVTRYMYAYDKSTPERLQQTNKPYHHVFDTEGQNIITNSPNGLYPHHRGIFIGWHDVEFKGKKYDFWAMTGGWRNTLPTVQVHQRFLDKTAGPVLASSKTLVNCNDVNDNTIITEQRKVTVFRQEAPTILLLDFCTELKAVAGDVFLNGDPEHGGMQYRPHNDVAAGSKTATGGGTATYLFHKDGIDPHEEKDLPWTAMSHPLGEKFFSVQHIDHPDNPRPTLYSAYRNYGRFGAFFKRKLKAGETVSARYRIWVGQGQMPPREEMSARYSAFAEPPQVQVLK